MASLSELLDLVVQSHADDIWLLLDIKVRNSKLWGLLYVLTLWQMDDDPEDLFHAMSTTLEAVKPRPGRPWRDRVMLGYWTVSRWDVNKSLLTPCSQDTWTYVKGIYQTLRPLILDSISLTRGDSWPFHGLVTLCFRPHLSRRSVVALSRLTSLCRNLLLHGRSMMKGVLNGVSSMVSMASSSVICSNITTCESILGVKIYHDGLSKLCTPS